MISENLNRIYNCIRKAAFKSGRNPDEIKLVAVTKTVDVDKINQAIDCGITAIGENRVQELIKKYPLINKEVEWHLIGHLQTNKVKYIIDKVNLIHSVDSIKLMEEINKRAKDKGRIMDILVEVNISGEASKFGIKPEDLFKFLKEASQYSNINVKGLMTIAPYCIDPEETRPYFKEMKRLFDEASQLDIHNVKMVYLSMGMSNDFEIAIEEGANIIRIGTALFGQRL